MFWFLDLFGYTSDHSCPIHHRIINYPSDTFPLKTSLNNKDNSINGIVLPSQTNGPAFHHLHHHHHHHGTCQRHLKPKRITGPIVNESMY